jgi:hypothetical protein
MAAVAFLVASLISLPSASACSCAGPNPICSAYWTTPVLFLGRAVQIEHVYDQPPPPNTVIPGQFLTHFEVTKLFRGKAGQEAVVHTSDQGSACGMGFEQGHEYLVFAYADEHGVLSTSHCTRTHEVQPGAADIDLQWIEALPKAPGGGVIFGTVQQLSMNEEGGYDTRALADVAVSIRGPQSKTVSSDSEGNFRAEGLAPGKYVVSAPAPAHYEPFADSAVTLRDHACAEVDWRTVVDGHIRGHIYFSDGHAAAGLVLTAQRRGEDGQWSSGANIITAGADGAFDLGRLQRGAYVFGVNLDFGPLDANAYYRKAFFPGAANRVEATVIELGAGQMVDNLRFYLPSDAPPPSIPVRVSVLGFDGKPTARAEILAYDDRWENSVTPVMASADENGIATLILRPGSHYDIEAVSNLPDNSQTCAEPIGVDAHPDAAPIILAMSHHVGNCTQFKKSAR